MKEIPEAIAEVFARRMQASGVSLIEQRQYLKWLRFYFDFCDKYNFPEEKAESLKGFINKLIEKRQTPENQRQANRSVNVYFDILSKNNAELNKVKEFTHAEQSPGLSWESVFEELKGAIRLRNYSQRTHTTYARWISRFEGYLKGKKPDKIEMADVKAFLTDLAVNAKVSGSTQNQAFNALLFLFRHVLKRENEFDAKEGIVRAKQKKYIPVVLTREEVDIVIAKLRYPYNLIAKMLYGCGLRLFECLNLRMHCLNLDEQILTVHDGKGQKDRTVPLPEVLLKELKSHIAKVKSLYEKDLNQNSQGVFLPGGIEKKYPGAALEFSWQWLFPAKQLTSVPQTGEKRRYHLHETHVQKAIRGAVKRAALMKRVTAYTFRHTFASHLLQANVDIRTIQTMLGHSDVRTTMIYTNTVKSRTIKKQISPLDMGKIDL